MYFPDFISTDGVIIRITQLGPRAVKFLLVYHVNGQSRDPYREILTGADVNGHLKLPGVSSIYPAGYENFPWALPVRAQHDS
jgi:hypothetical protein